VPVSPEETCSWKIRFGTTEEFTVQCDKLPHADSLMHTGCFFNPMAENGYTVIQWMPGDRREYQGDWPGSCAKEFGCILPDKHPRGCAL
jgi:hypothetical protein